MANFKDPKASNVVVVNFDRASTPRPNLANQQISEKKRRIFEDWLKKGIVAVVLDARSRGVKVPPAYVDQPELILNFSYDFHVPDFNFNEVGVWATLSFDEGEFFCMVPWESVIGFYSAAFGERAQGFDFDDEQDEFKQRNDLDKKNNVIEFDFGGKITF